MQTSRLSAAAGTLLINALALAGVVTFANQAPVREEAKPLEVSLVIQEPAPPAEVPPEPIPPPPVPPPPPPPKQVVKPPPPKPREKPVKQVTPTPAPAPAPAPVAMAPEATETSQSTITAEPAPPATPVAAVEAPPPPPVRTAPREDASWAGNTKPPYPALARRLGEQGEVRLEVLVAEDGSATEVKIKRSSGSTVLDKAARETALKWRFRPATVGGKPVAEWYNLTFHFNLDA